MVILVPPFRSGALYNFCYNAILLYSVFHLHYLHGIGECFYEEDKLNGFSFGFCISMVHDLNILLLYRYNLCAYIRPSGIRLSRQQQNFVTIGLFALSYLFIKMAYLHCSLEFFDDVVKKNWVC